MPGTFAKYRARGNLVALVAVDLGVSTVTVYSWCRELGINIDDYRKVEA